MKCITFLIPIIAGGVLSSCSDEKTLRPLTQRKKPLVQIVNYPLYYFAQQLAADDFDLRYIVNPKGDPAFWTPTDKDVQAFQNADLIIRNGANYAKWMKTVSLPTRKTLDASAAFSSKLIREKGTSHQHGDGVAHEHGDLAFTVWLDFTLAEKQAEAIGGRFAALMPKSGDRIQQDLEKLKAELQSLDKKMMTISAKWGEKPLLVSHPLYQYWARRYGLKIQAVHWEPDMKWDSKHEQELTKTNAEHKARLMIWEGTPSSDLIAKLKAKGIESVVFDPCGNSPGKNKDWISVMKANIAAFEKMTDMK